jgi:hexosaminidase
MHDTAGMTLQTWHFGGDEAINILASDGFEVGPGKDPEKGDTRADMRNKPWSNSPQCQKLIASGEVKALDELGELYAKRVSRLVVDAGIPTMAAWNDGVKKIDNAGDELATQHNYVNSWAPLFWGGGDESAHFAETGFDLVQSHSDYLYFDMPQEVDPAERGYYWASRYTDTRKTFSYAPLNTAQQAELYPNRDGHGWEATSPAPEFANSVRGIQGQLWSEVVRTDEAVEYQVLRLASGELGTAVEARPEILRGNHLREQTGTRARLGRLLRGARQQGTAETGPRRHRLSRTGARRNGGR